MVSGVYVVQFDEDFDPRYNYPALWTIEDYYVLLKNSVLPNFSFDLFIGELKPFARSGFISVQYLINLGFYHAKCFKSLSS